MLTRQAISSRDWGDDAAAVTPYQLAAQVWDKRVGTQARRAASWRFFAVGALLTNVGALGAMWHLAQLPKAEVHIVQVDTVGRAQYVGRAGTTWDNFQLSRQQIAFHLSEWLRRVRAVPADEVIFRDNWSRAYTFLAGAAVQTMNTLNTESKPMERMRDTRVNIVIETVLRQSDASWQIDWIEETWEKTGHLRSRQKWRATFVLDFQQPSPASIKDNPIGLYITDFSWAPVDA